MHTPAPQSGACICLGSKNKYFGILLCSFSDQTPLGSNLHVIKAKEKRIFLRKNSLIPAQFNRSFSWKPRKGPFFSVRTPRSPSVSGEDRLPVSETRKSQGSCPRARVCDLGVFRHQQLQPGNWAKGISSPCQSEAPRGGERGAGRRGLRLGHGPRCPGVALTRS